MQQHSNTVNAIIWTNPFEAYMSRLSRLNFPLGAKYFWMNITFFVSDLCIIFDAEKWPWSLNVVKCDSYVCLAGDTKNQQSEDKGYMYM